MHIEDIGEFGLIERIARLVKIKDENVLLGIGDDAAAVKADSELLTLLTSDILIENVHFRLDFSTAYQLGYKAIISNISDIAAMAGLPRYGLISLGIKPGTEVGFIEDLYQGILAGAGEYKVEIVGGDTVQSLAGLVIAVALTGEVEPNLLRKRSGAQLGDSILVTGKLGASAAGLYLLLNPEKEVPQAEILKKVHLLPKARVQEARIAARLGATALEDISDGLASEIGHICEQSQVGAKIFSSQVPIAEGVAQVGQLSGRSALELALKGGEDYELVMIAPAASAHEIAREIFKETATSVTAVGEIIESSEEMVLVDEEGKATPLGKGYEHFRE